MKSFAKYTLKVILGLCLVIPTLASPILPMPHSLALRSTRLSNVLKPNSPSSGGNAADSGFFNSDWVKISEAPPRVVQQLVGSRLELECEAVGTNPMIQWIKGDSPLTENESYESNAISEQIDQGLSKIKARLIINSILPPHQGPLTCVATAGSKTASASTNLFVIQGKSASGRNFSDFLSTLPFSQPRVRIILWNTFIMTTQGSDIIVPCKAIALGSPHPEVFWLDANEQLVTGQDPRVKVLSDGELRIRDLGWQDMGAYTCIARNAFSKDSISTFIYPLLNEN